jgi:3-hydroxyacyl-[acyl-carrier-protein] dehydratase
MADISVQDLLALLPHRYPMLLVDKVLSCDDKTRITAVKNVSFNEPFFSGHFPGRPVMPGVLQIEAMAQTGGLLMMRLRPGPAGRLPVFMGIDKARFRRMVVPGDQLRMEIELLTLRGPVARFAGKAFVGDALASEAELTCMLTEQEKQA